MAVTMGKLWRGSILAIIGVWNVFFIEENFWHRKMVQKKIFQDINPILLSFAVHKMSELIMDKVVKI